MGLLASKIEAGFVISPWTMVTLGFEVRDCALLALRVRARIWNGALLAIKASSTAPPCFPVAPVTKIFLAFGTGGILGETLPLRAWSCLRCWSFSREIELECSDARREIAVEWNWNCDLDLSYIAC